MVGGYSLGVGSRTSTRLMKVILAGQSVRLGDGRSSIKVLGWVSKLSNVEEGGGGGRRGGGGQ